MKESGLSLKKRQYNIGFSTFKLPSGTDNILWLTSYNLNIIFDEFSIWFLGLL